MSGARRGSSKSAMIQRTLGKRIRRVRQRTGAGLSSLAADLRVSASYLSHIESGRRGPGHRLLEELARKLELDLDELLAAAGRLDPETRRYLARSPAAVRLCRGSPGCAWTRPA